MMLPTAAPLGALPEKEFDMTPSHVTTRTRKTLSRLLPWAVAIATLGASAPGHAANGEADVFEAHWSQPGTVSGTAGDTRAMAPSRADVRESLQTARAADVLLRNGEIAEPQELMQAREDFIAMQTEQLHIEYMAAVTENARVARLEEERQARILAQAESEHIAQLVDEATDRVAMRPEEVEIWVEPGTTVEELVSYIEQSAHPDAVTVLLVETPVHGADPQADVRDLAPIRNAAD